MNTTIKIQNLKCGGCANTITSKLNDVDGISNTTVDVEQEAVSFDFENESNLETVTLTLKKLGYPVIGDENSFGLKAKSYVSCAIGKVS